MAGKIFTQDVLGVKVKTEADPGTFEAPDTVIYLERGAGYPSPEFDKVSIDPQAATSGTKYDIIIEDNARINYDVTQKMSDDKTDFLPLLLASNFVGEVVAVPAAGISYTMKTRSTSSLSIEWIDPRTTIQGKGAKGALSLKAEVGKPVELKFALLANYHGETVLSAVDPDNTLPTADVSGFLYMRKNCQGYTINGVAAHFESFEIDWGSKLVQPNTTCEGANYPSEYAPTIKITQSLTEEGEASFSELKTNSAKNIIIPFYDIAGVKRAEIQIPNAVPSDLKKNGTDGRLKADRSFSCRPVTGDDNIALIIFD